MSTAPRSFRRSPAGSREGGRRERVRVATRLAALCLLLAGCGGEHAATRFEPLRVGRPAPAYAVRTFDGDSARVGDAAPVTLLNVWATWCVPCQQEFPELQRLHEAYGARGLRVLAVSIDQGADPGVAAFVREHAATFTIGRDPAGRVQDAFQTIGVPETFLIAADGTLLWRRVGELRRNDAELAAALERALRG